MNYIKENKAAWEEAFEHRHPGWGEENYIELIHERLPFFCPDVIKELEAIEFKEKTISQFCCNNGRELLSLMQLGLLFLPSFISIWCKFSQRLYVPFS